MDKNTENISTKKNKEIVRRKISMSEKAVLQARGETLIVMGAIICGFCLLLAFFELANERSVFGYLTIIVAYLAGASLYSYKYQRTKGFMIFGVVGVVLALFCFFAFCFL